MNTAKRVLDKCMGKNMGMAPGHKFYPQPEFTGGRRVCSMCGKEGAYLVKFNNSDSNYHTLCKNCFKNNKVESAQRLIERKENKKTGEWEDQPW